MSNMPEPKPNYGWVKALIAFVITVLIAYGIGYQVGKALALKHNAQDQTVQQQEESR